jgi:hypothetical protein
MKLIYTALLAFTLANTYTLTAQTADKEPVPEKLSDGPEYDKHYQKLKELYIKQLKSESYKKYFELNRSFINKMNYKGKISKLGNNMLGWIKENIGKTSFESYEAAEKEWQAVQAASRKSMGKNKEYYDYTRTCIKCCGSEMIAHVLTEVMQEHPELVFGE